MNPVLHGALKSIYVFVANIFFWPLTLFFLAVSGVKQALTASVSTALCFWIAKRLVILAILPFPVYFYLISGLLVAMVFHLLFGTFRNGWFVYPTLGFGGAWLGCALAWWL